MDGERNASVVPRNAQGLRDWDALYQKEPVETMPWYCEDLDADMAWALERYADEERGKKRLLDLGTGPGTQSAVLARLGYQVTATDISPAAVWKAAQRFADLDINFVVDDITKTAEQGPFDWIVDRGCFHVLLPEQRNLYVRNCFRLLAPKGMLLLKCFSGNETWSEGPYRFFPEDIERIFSGSFQCLFSRESFFLGTLKENPKALFSVLAKG
ncbi:class I SAM-dependent methyltransferase [Magnetococcales bacterium HHB-1]